MSDHRVAIDCRKENRKTVSPVLLVLPCWPLDDEEEGGRWVQRAVLVNVG